MTEKVGDVEGTPAWQLRRQQLKLARGVIRRPNQPSAPDTDEPAAPSVNGSKVLRKDSEPLSD